MQYVDFHRITEFNWQLSHDAIVDDNFLRENSLLKELNVSGDTYLVDNRYSPAHILLIEANAIKHLLQ